MSTPLIEAPKKKGRLYAIIAVAILVVAAVVTGIIFSVNAASGANAAGKGGDTNSNAIETGKGSPSDPVKIGVANAGEAYWDTYVKAAKDAGISVKIVSFTDYQQPNPALTNGDIDLNQFQHIIFLANYNVQAHQDLAPIGATAIYPLALYSKKYTDVADIPSGATIAIPNDPSNLARSLLVLQSAGLITLKDGGSIFATLDDIDKGASKVTVKPLDAALTARSLPDVAGAIVNNDFVADAGLKNSEAIAKDDPSDPNAIPYVNVWAARAEDKDNPLYLKLVKIYQENKAVTDGVLASSGGTAVLATTPVDELEASLAKVEKDTAAHQ